MIPIVYAHLPVSPSQLFLSCLAPPDLLRSSVPFFLSCSSHPRSQCAHLCLLRSLFENKPLGDPNAEGVYKHAHPSGALTARTPRTQPGAWPSKLSTPSGKLNFFRKSQPKQPGELPLLRYIALSLSLILCYFYPAAVHRSASVVSPISLRRTRSVLV